MGWKSAAERAEERRRAEALRLVRGPGWAGHVVHQTPSSKITSGVAPESPEGNAVKQSIGGGHRGEETTTTTTTQLPRLGMGAEGATVTTKRPRSGRGPRMSMPVVEISANLDGLAGLGVMGTKGGGGRGPPKKTQP